MKTGIKVVSDYLEMRINSLINKFHNKPNISDAERVYISGLIEAYTDMHYALHLVSRMPDNE